MKLQLFSLTTAALLSVACAPVAVDDPVILPPVDGLTQCKADQYQRYVGRNRSDLPARPSNEVWRVTCTTCPVTMDYRSERLNILFERGTGVIREVKCG